MKNVVCIGVEYFCLYAQWEVTSQVEFKDVASGAVRLNHRFAKVYFGIVRIHRLSAGGERLKYRGFLLCPSKPLISRRTICIVTLHCFTGGRERIKYRRLKFCAAVRFGMECLSCRVRTLLGVGCRGWNGLRHVCVVCIKEPDIQWEGCVVSGVRPSPH